MTIRKQTVLGFSIIVLLLALELVAATVVRSLSMESGDDAMASGRSVQGTLLPLERLARIAQFDVIQVQQFLSDASATHHQDSFDDAGKYAKDFQDRVAAIRTIINSSEGRAALGGELGKLESALAKCEQHFPEFNKLGIEMARVYIANGVEAGNVLMEKFDPMSDDLTAQLQVLVDGATSASDAGSNSLLEHIGTVITFLTYENHRAQRKKDH